MRYVSRMVVLGICTVVPGVLLAQGGQTLSITNYQFVSSQQVTATMANVTYQADVVNTGKPEAAVLATADTLNPGSFTMVLGQNTLTFAPVPANSQVTSSNTFTIRVNRTVPFDFANLQWTFQTTPLPPVERNGSTEPFLSTSRIYNGRSRPRRCRRSLTPAPTKRQRRSEETRLNSSHLVISYAVFCLKKKQN